MSANQADFPIADMARTFGVSKAGYHARTRQHPSAHAVADAALLKRIRTVIAARGRPTARRVFTPTCRSRASGIPASASPG